jgi:hypothetical protein
LIISDDRLPYILLAIISHVVLFCHGLEIHDMTSTFKHSLTHDLENDPCADEKNVCSSAVG